MDKLSRLVGFVACWVGVAAAGATAIAGVAQYIGNGWWNENGTIYHTPHYMMTRAQVAHLHDVPNIQLTYGGGPVLLQPHVYVVYWGFTRSIADPDHVRPLETKYLKNVGGSAWENDLTQYYGPGTQFIQNITHQLMGTWVDPIVPQLFRKYPTDAEVAAEATRLMMHFGGIDNNGSYVVQTPHNYNTLGFGTSFCAYHSVTSTSLGVISYTNEPYMPDAGANCGAGFISPPNDESSADEGVTIVEGHEYAGSITDPQPFSGWSSTLGEVGDLCVWMDIQNDQFGRLSYTMQPLFDNMTGGCTHNGP